MSEYVIQGQTLTGIADAIRAQLGTEQQYTPESMAAAIGSIQGGEGTELADSILEKSFSGTYKSANLTSIHQYMMQSVAGLTGLYCPSLQVIGNAALSYCRNVLYILVGPATISPSAFNTCEKLVAFIVNGDTVSNLQNANAFANTPIASGTGYIYVSDSLVTEYKGDTNWVTYANQIKGKSELPAEVQEWLDKQGGASA